MRFQVECSLACQELVPLPHPHSIHASFSLRCIFVQSCFKDLHFQVPEGEVQAYFTESDMDGSGKIDFREFVVIIALSYLLAPPKRDGALSPQLQKAVESIVDAFLFCDKDGSGYVSKDEITNSFAETSGNLRRPTGGVKSVVGPRWLEMDWDANGKVSFKEFLFAFADWVGADEDEEDS